MLGVCACSTSIGIRFRTYLPTQDSRPITRERPPSRFRRPIYTCIRAMQPPRGPSARVESRTKARKIPPEKSHRSFFQEHAPGGVGVEDKVLVLGELVEGEHDAGAEPFVPDPVARDGGVEHLNRLAANRFADKTLFTPSVLGYPFFTWQFGVVQSDGSSADRFAAKGLTSSIGPSRSIGSRTSAFITCSSASAAVGR